MDFNHTEERRMLVETLRRFFQENYTFDDRMKIVAEENGFSQTLWVRLAELGIVGALFGEDEGGFGGHGFDIALVFEEIGRAGVVEPFLQTAILGGGLIADLGNDTQKALIERVIAGETHLAFAHGEPDGRYDLNEVVTTATSSDDGYTLNGRKAVVQNAATADHFVISARTAGAYDDEAGLSLFLLPKDTSGLTCRDYPTMDGGRASDLTLENLHVPQTALLGEEGAAFPAIERRAAMACLALSAEALGAMESAKDMTLEYLKTRVQFGKPIGMFQALQHRMAELLIEIEQMRSAVVNAAGALSDERSVREKAASAAKNLAGRVGKLVAEEAIQMHGGIGMTWEYALPHFAKRIVMIDHLYGDTDHHMERYIALSREAP